MKTKVMEVTTYKKQTSKTKYIMKAAFEYKPQFFFRKKKSRGFYSTKYGSNLIIRFYDFTWVRDRDCLTWVR